MKVFLLFLDGVGIGPKDPARNPFFAARLPVLTGLLGAMLPHHRRRRVEAESAVAFPIDANLRMPGLPQSGTGQTSIFTGVNGARKFGKHFGPYPPTPLRPIIAQRNIFRMVRSNGGRAILANAFPQRFFEFTAQGTRRLTVPTMSSLAADIPLLTARELALNRAISADFVRSRWGELGHPEIEPVTARTSGHHCADIIHDHDLTVFDYWLTDHAGHEQNMSRAVMSLELLDEFLGGILERVDLRSTLVLAVSDHGNIEDLSVKTHTRNPALGLAIGHRRHEAASRIRSLTHIVPCVLECLNTPH